MAPSIEWRRPAATSERLARHGTRQYSSRQRPSYRAARLVPASPHSPSTDTRLNGWKDIATYLGKGVRTVQRWEKVYGLPVHRIGQEHGDIVFAFAREIDRWLVEFEQRRPGNGHGSPLDATDDTDDTPSSAVAAPIAQVAASSTPVVAIETSATPEATRRRRTSAKAWLAAAMLTIAIAAGLHFSTLPLTPGTTSALTLAAPGAQPASWRVQDDRLVVFDDRGAELWSHPFDFDLNEGSYTAPPYNHFYRRVLIEDLDNDGTREVVMTTGTQSREDQGLYVFEGADGDVRFAHHPTPTVQFGRETYSPPWAAHGLATTRNADGTRSIWISFIHGLYFPTLLEQLDARGNIVSHYWSNGYITAVSTGRWRGVQAVFVGATNNETLGGSLAIFSGTSIRGQAPAVLEPYRCQECETASPDAFFVFPRSCLLAAEEVQADVTQAWEDASGTLMIVASQGRVALENGLQGQLAAYYAIPADFARADVEISREFLAAHAAAREQHRLDHDFGSRDEHMLQPVLRWESHRFVPLAVGATRR